MIVLTMENCPPKLRGDLSKWLCEINTGVYVGNVSSRVRDALWDRVCKNLKNGQATLVYTAPGEQKLEFRTHNTAWEPVDFDGIKLMRRPLPQSETAGVELKRGFSKAAKQQYARKAVSAHPKTTGDYTVIDLETTGLDAAADDIIEYGALRVRDGQPTEEFTMLVRTEMPLPAAITQLTGITPEELSGGAEPLAALQAYLAFLGKDKLVGHNIAFDMEFLRAACRAYEQPAPANHCVDVVSLARRSRCRTPNHKLITLAQHFALADTVPHRALPDCRLINEVFQKLNETSPTAPAK